MNDTPNLGHRLLYAREASGGLLWGLTVAAVGLAGPGSAEAITAWRPESQRLIVWFGDATSLTPLVGDSLVRTPDSPPPVVLSLAN